MTTTSRQKRMAKKRNAQIQALAKRTSNRVEKALLIMVRGKPMPDMPAIPSKTRTSADPEKRIAAVARQKMRRCSKLPRGVR
ncbi:hypothetical protein AXW37_06270 [Yersinia ruckeri]|uniref:hypothetical protein n=1 Tax=Yersinia ruckeri TaxID=29486 RepID=UPI0004E2E079|nr:hypothetical protein [Yersinia ruckeri]ARZ00506.1 hypothetical protein QMA0440_01162 [Yersinia ruckeri]KFE38113.1 hypothetical protein nADLYRO1b_2369 [Yersinia ruckeri]MCW6524261.1 hypothetical protein [Yersinia ruckeri]MCW6528375.1 hypothetical protein [Yersinia ruckeri]MCW6563323.1 hypothetical protein [Yersinia ruckeri]